MAKIKGFLNKVAHEPVFHKTSIGRKPSLTKMNNPAGVVLKNTVARGSNVKILFMVNGLVR